MWPLLAEGSGRDREEEKDNADPSEQPRWDGDAHRAYFNEFRAIWSRAHSSSLRKLPSMDERDDVVAQSAKMRLCEEANRVWQTVTSGGEDAARGRALGVEDALLSSVWTHVQLAKKANTTVREKSDKKDTSCARKQEGKAIDDLRDTIWILKRQDNGYGRSAIRRLQDESKAIYEARLKEPPALTECPVVWDTVPVTKRSMAADEQRRHSKESTKHAVANHQTGSAMKPPRMIDAPCHLVENRVKNAGNGLVLQANQLLKAITLRVCGPTESDALDVRLPSIFDTMKQPLTFICPGGELSSPIVASNEEVPNKESICSQDRAPKRIKFGGLLKQHTCRTPISALASAVLKAVVKKNASLLFGGSVPGCASSDIGMLLRRASSSTKLPGESDFITSDGIQLLVLPPEIVAGDGKRVDAANQILQEQAHQVCRTIQTPNISLTSVSLALPSVWRHKPTLDSIQRFKLRQLALPDHLEVRLEDPVLVPVTGIKHTSKAKTPPVLEAASEWVVTPHDVTHDVNTTGSKIVCDDMTRSSQTIAPSTFRKVAFKIQADVSTEDLVASYLGVEYDVIPSRSERSSSHSVASSEDPKAQSKTDDSQLMKMIDQLARPAIWFLVRLKMVKVNSKGKLDGLRSIHLEVLETIALQLHSKLREVSVNLSKLQAEDIIETCSAFRHAVWLHTLRLIVTCHAESLKSAINVARRLLESPRCQLSIGAKQVTTLFNLYRSMGGSTDSILPRHLSSDSKPVENRPLKKLRPELAQPDASPVRVICDIRLLERDDLLEAMSDLQVFVVERDLSPAIDLIIDERNAVAVLGQQHFEDEHQMRTLTYELASSQVQFEKLWLLIDDVKNEDALHFFYAALANFAVDVQTFVCKGAVEIGEVIRGVVDACAEIALSQHRVLPKMWFARPFMLEEESQLERFLSSTRIVSSFAAQSILHRLSIEDLTTKSLEEVSILIGSLPHDEVDLLWRLFNSSHGIGVGIAVTS